MTESERKLGLWSTVGLTIVGYLYAASYIAFAVLFPVREWRGMADFASYYTGGYAALFTFVQVCAFLLSLLFLSFSAVAYRVCPERNKAYALAGLCSAAVFCGASCFHYVVQWTSIRAGLQGGSLAGLELFVMQNYDSPLSILNVMAWTLFLGVSYLSFAACFEGRAVRTGFLINGAASVAAFVPYVLGWKAAMLIWTAVLSVTWYVYPVLIGRFRKRGS